MKRQTRYLFIILGLAVFLVLGPLVVLFVSGVSYDWHNSKYIRTGIISIKSDPSKAEILLDGKHVGTTAANIRFLQPKEYVVTLRKDGYYDWSKRIDIKASKATILAGSLDKIYLIKQHPGITTLGTDVIDFAQTSDYLTYITPLNLVIDRGSDFSNQTTISIPTGLDHITVGGNNDYVILSGPSKIVLVTIADQKITDITAQLKTGRDLTLTNDDLILFINPGNQLVSYDPSTAKNSPLLDRVNTFKLADGLLYYLQDATLHVATLSGTVTNNNQKLLDTGLDSTTNPQLFITSNKDIAFLTNNTLYRVNASLQLISQDIKEVFFDPLTRTLAFRTANELQLYNFNGNNSSLITRSVQDISYPAVISTIGYAVYIQNNTIRAIELDALDHQNNYDLAKFARVSRLTVGANGKFVLVLDGNKLQQITFR